MKKSKLIMDLLLAIFLGLSMAYTLTGGLVHEIIGMVLIVCMLIHLFRRFRYYSSTSKALKNKKLGGRLVALYIINIVMIFVTAVMLNTSVLISKELFAFIDLSALSVGRGTIRLVHVICSIVLLICVFLHVCLHSKMFYGMIKRAAKNDKTATALKTASRIIAAALAILIVKVSIDAVYSASIVFAADIKRQQLIAYNSEKSNTVSTEEITETTELETEIESILAQNETRESFSEEDSHEITTEETYVEPESTTPEVSLADYLAQFTCNGCGKHCLLTNPRCGRGEVEASEKIEEYFSLYGSEETDDEAF